MPQGTKAQSRTKLVIPTVYTFVLLRVFVPSWLFSTPLEIRILGRSPPKRSNPKTKS